MSEKPTTAADEELTPEEIRQAFRRYDWVIAGFVVLMAFFAASFLSTAPDLWRRLATGRILAQNITQSVPIDSFAYTARPDVSGTNPTWLYDVGSYLVFQMGEIPLVATKIALVVLTAICLLALWSGGPTLGWTALCAGLAVVGMSGRLDLGPHIVGYLLLAFLLFLGQRSWFWGLTGALASAGLLLAWSMLDGSYFIGLATLVAMVLSRFMMAEHGERRNALLPLIGLASVLTPMGLSNVRWLIESWPTRPDLPILDIGDEGWMSTLDLLREGAWSASLVAMLVLAALAVMVILLNVTRIDVGRIALLILALAILTAERWLGFSCILLAATAALGGQEFHLARLGTDVRVGFWPLFWSQMFRVALIILAFVGLLGTLTGRIQDRVAQFGFGIDRAEFAETASDWLAQSELKGRTFSISPNHRLSSYLAWSRPDDRAFVDVRWPNENEAWRRYELARLTLASGSSKEEGNDPWRSVFEELGVSHLILDARDESDAMRVVRRSLSARSDWAPIYVDEQCVIYGWLNEKVADYERIRSLRLQANELAFHSERPPAPPTERTVTPPGFIDAVWPVRFTVKPPGLIQGTFFSSGGRWLTQPGSNMLAVYHLREAVSAQPDSPDANLRLGLAYLGLSQYEMSQLNRVPTTSAAQVRMIPSEMILTRHHQTISALMNAKVAGADNLGLHTALAIVARSNNFLDLWLHELEDQRRFADDSEQLASIDADIGAVRGEVNRVTKLYEEGIRKRNEELAQQAQEADKEATSAIEELAKATGDDRPPLEQKVEFFRQRAAGLRSASETDRPIENSQIALALGLPLRSMAELEKVPIASPDAAMIGEYSAKLYLRLGEPAKALERLRVLRGSNQLRAGVYEWFLAQIQITSGQFEEARNSLEQSLARLRMTRSNRTLSLMEQRVRTGQMISPGGMTVGRESTELATDDAYEASYLFDLAMVHLELGEADLAAKELLQLLEINPRFQLRPLAETYIREITGTPPPPAPEIAPDDQIAVRFEPKPEEKKDEATPEPPPSEPKDG